MKSKKVVSLILMLVVVSSGLLGCGKTSEDKNENTKTNASAVDSKNGTGTQKKFTYWVPMHGNAATYLKSYADSEMYKELEKKTGVHIEFIHPPQSQIKEAFNLMVNSKDLPDMISQTPEYTGGPDKAIEDGIYLKLNDLIEKNAPNYKKIRESNKEIARQTITDSKNIWAFYCLQTEIAPPWAGPSVRQDWLDELGMKVPETLDDWETMLKAFKDKKKTEAPLMLDKSGKEWVGTFLSAFGIGPDFYVDNGKVKYGPAETKYKDYLTLMNKWYKEGLLDRDFATRDDKSASALITGNGTGAKASEAYGSIDFYHGTMRKDNPKAKWLGIPYPVLKKGDKILFRQKNEYNKGTPTVITTSCKDPAAAAAWLDYGYSKEGFMLFNYGIENVSYKMVDGKPQFTDLILKNPNNLSYQITSWIYKLHMGPYLRKWDAIPPLSEEAKVSIENWSKAEDSQVMPPIVKTADESKKYSSLMTEINTYIEEMNLKFITGDEPLSKLDDFVKQLKKMGIDDAIKINQSALDRYNKR